MASTVDLSRFAALGALLVSLFLALGVSQAHAATGYTSAGSFGSAHSLGCPSAIDGEFCTPKRVAVDADNGNVYVVDRDNDRVQVFAPDGDGATFLTQITGLDDPYGIAIDQAASPISIYVSHAGAIAKLDSDGNPTPAFTPNASFVSPLQGGSSGKVGSFQAPLAVDPISGDVLVGDTGKDIVQRYTGDGAFVSDFDGADAPDGQFTGLEDIAVDGTGQILVVDAAPEGAATGGAVSRLDRFSAAGAHELNLRPLQDEGDGLVAVDPATGNVVVARVRPFEPRMLILEGSTGDRIATITPALTQIVGLTVDGGPSGRLYAATDDAACSFGCGRPTGVQMFTPNTLPTPAVEPATDVAAQTATLHGSVNPNGFATTARFELSSDGGASWFSVGDVDPAPGDGNVEVDVSFAATGLQQGTEYRVRVVASNPGGAEVVSPTTETFTTDALSAPIVTIDPPTGVDADSADVAGTINPNGPEVSYWFFEYSSDGGANWATAGGDPLPAGTTAVDVSKTLTGLDAGADYLVRLVAGGPGGQTASSDESFSTPLAPPTATTGDAGPKTTTTATLNGRIGPNGSPTYYYFEYGPDASYGTRVPVVDAYAGTGNATFRVSRGISGLTPGATYHYRLVAVNAEGTTEGDDRTFTTHASLDQRAYEMVSLPDKNGAEIVGIAEGGTLAGYSRASTDGNRFVYAGSAPFGGAPSSGVQAHFLATRTPGGWSSTSLNLPQAPSARQTLSAFSFGRANDDLSKIALSYNDPAPVQGAPEGEYNLFVRDTATSGLTLVTPLAPITPYASASQQAAAFVGGSSDFSSVAVVTDYSGTATYSPDHPVGKGGVYQFSDGVFSYVGYDEQGDPIPEGVKPATNRRDEALTAGSDDIMSEDGSVTVFMTNCSDQNAAPCELWARVDGAITRRVSRPDPGVPEPPGPTPAHFEGLSKDGSTILFTAPQQLTEDAADGMNLYAYEVATDELTRLADGNAVYGLSRDARRIYFNSNSDGIKLWEDGQVRAVAAGTVGGSYSTSAETMISPDGRYFFWTSPEELTGQETAGYRVVYRYDADADEIKCVSCVITGPPTNDIGIALAPPVHMAQQRQLSDDGRFAFWQTDMAMVPSDTNNRIDVYQYDDDSGEVSLVSTGQSNRNSRFIDASADGRTVFFTTKQQLVGSDFDQDTDLYAARLGGGFPEGEPPLSRCVGDACQGGVSTPPASAAPGTGAFAGPGNEVVKRPASCSALKRKLARAKRKLANTSGRRAQVRRKQVRKLKRALRDCRGGRS